MRFHITSAFSAAQAAWQDAYDTHDRFASAGDDNSERATAAGNREYEAVDELLLFPAVTPTEVQAKLAFMVSRNVVEWNDDFPRFMAQIERDLVELQRPAVSPAIAEKFEAWREAHRVNYEDRNGDDAADEALGEAAASASIALYGTPCTTPGDLIVKLYMEMLGEHGTNAPYAERRDGITGGTPFELCTKSLTEGMGTVDGAGQEAFARDIADCDLGRCLLALGRVDFDAADWLAASMRAQMVVAVIIQPGGQRVLWTGETEGAGSALQAERFNRCQALIAGGLGVVAAERRRAVADLMAELQPSLVLDCRECDPIDQVAA